MVTVARERFEIAASVFFSGFVLNYELRSSEFFHFFTDVDFKEKRFIKDYNALLNDKNVKYVFRCFFVLHDAFTKKEYITSVV